MLKPSRAVLSPTGSFRKLYYTPMPSEPSTASRLIASAIRNEYRLLALMLMLLHSAVWWDFGGYLSRSLLLAHLGLFLIWQPVWRRDQRLEWQGSLNLILPTLAFIYWLNWPLVTFWVLLLTGIVGGRVTAARAERNAYMIALIFLVSELLIGCLPPMFSIYSLATEVQVFFGYALFVLPLGLLVFPTRERGHERTRAVDFLYGLTVSLLAAILGLGSLLSTYSTGAPYATALLQAIVAISLFLLAISWLWAPQGGFSGLGQLWERYLLNIGTPFEQWAGGVARLADQQQSPREFLPSAMQQFIDLPWVAGITWNATGSKGSLGTVTRHTLRVRDGEVQGVVYAHRPLGTALLLHGKLLLNLLGHFYSAKERERELAQQAHLQAIYETGARVTHDIKNLLQSLNTLTLALQQSGGEQRADALRLLENQLPHITQRLQLALDKLQTPVTEQTTQMLLSEWWENLKTRNLGRRLHFHETLTADPLIPLDCFDSVVENLLENARFKRQSEPALSIYVEVTADADHLELSVRDTGAGISAETAGNLFKGALPSASGLGIGLYQAARQAEQAGFKLRLRGRKAGDVCFVLERVSQGL